MMYKVVSMHLLYKLSRDATVSVLPLTLFCLWLYTQSLSPDQALPPQFSMFNTRKLGGPEDGELGSWLMLLYPSVTQDSQ